MATYQFQCASPVCSTKLTAHTRDEVISLMTAHVKVQHRIPKPTRPIMQFLEDNTIHELAATKGSS